MEITLSSSNIDIYTRLEVLLVLKLSRDTDTITEARNLIDELYKRGEIQNELKNRISLDKFCTREMQLPIKLFEQHAFKTRPKIEEPKSIFMNKPTHEENLSQPSQTKNKQHKIISLF